jgi:hypothetical protein
MLSVRDRRHPEGPRGEPGASCAGGLLRLGRRVAILLVLLAGAASVGASTAQALAVWSNMRIAVFPVENLSGRTAPLRAIRTMVIERVRALGFAILDDTALDTVLRRHRVRYTAGVEQGLALALRAETATEGILIPTLELFDDTRPPKVAMFWRLVSTGDDPAVLWLDGTGMAGDDAPGLLGLGLVVEPEALVGKAVDALARSLAGVASAPGEARGRSPARKFFPKTLYRSDLLDAREKYSVAIMPFFNKTGRKYAGEIVALHMMRNFMAFQNFSMVEPGMVRQELLKSRIIMNEGVSLPETDTILNAVNADLVLNGEVLDYEDYRGADGVAKVDFSVLFIERTSRKVVYSSYSQNRGSDGVVLFDWGRVNTAHAMAAQMARAVATRMLAGGRAPQPASRPGGMQ